jgi:hypothetical protein
MSQLMFGHAGYEYRRACSVLNQTNIAHCSQPCSRTIQPAAALARPRPSRPGGGRQQCLSFRTSSSAAELFQVKKAVGARPAAAARRAQPRRPQQCRVPKPETSQHVRRPPAPAATTRAPGRGGAGCCAAPLPLPLPLLPRRMPRRAELWKTTSYESHVRRGGCCAAPPPGRRHVSTTRRQRPPSSAPPSQVPAPGASSDDEDGYLTAAEDFDDNGAATPSRSRQEEGAAGWPSVGPVCAQELRATKELLRGMSIEQAQADGWQPAAKWKGEDGAWAVACRKPATDDTGVYVFFFEAVFPSIPAETILRCQTDLDFRKDWDAYCADIGMLRGAGAARGKEEGNDVVYWAVKYPWPLTNRDYVYFRRIEHEEEEEEEEEAAGQGQGQGQGQGPAFTFVSRAAERGQHRAEVGRGDLSVCLSCLLISAGRAACQPASCSPASVCGGGGLVLLCLAARCSSESPLITLSQ